VEKDVSAGWPRRSDEGVDRVRQAFTWSPKKSIFQVSAELQMLQMTIHRIFFRIAYI
jgi:hypothetical protein